MDNADRVLDILIAFSGVVGDIEALQTLISLSATKGDLKERLPHLIEIAEKRVPQLLFAIEIMRGLEF